MTRHDDAVEKATAVLADWTRRHPSLQDKAIARDTIAAYEAHMRPQITTVEELDALPEGAVILCRTERSNPNWPTLFLQTGFRPQWMELDPSDRDDGEIGTPSGAVLNHYGNKSIQVLHWGTA